MTEHTLTNVDLLANEIARVRHGQNVTASDLAQRLAPWLAAHDREVAAAAREHVAAWIEAGMIREAADD